MAGVTWRGSVEAVFWNMASGVCRDRERIASRPVLRAVARWTWWLGIAFVAPGGANEEGRQFDAVAATDNVVRGLSLTDGRRSAWAGRITHNPACLRARHSRWSSRFRISPALVWRSANLAVRTWACPTGARSTCGFGRCGQVGLHVDTAPCVVACLIVAPVFASRSDRHGVRKAL